MESESRTRDSELDSKSRKNFAIPHSWVWGRDADAQNFPQRPHPLSIYSVRVRISLRPYRVRKKIYRVRRPKNIARYLVLSSLIFLEPWGPQNCSSYYTMAFRVLLACHFRQMFTYTNVDFLLNSAENFSDFSASGIASD